MLLLEYFDCISPSHKTQSEAAIESYEDYYDSGLVCFGSRQENVCDLVSGNMTKLEHTIDDLDEAWEDMQRNGLEDIAQGAEERLGRTTASTS